MDARQVKSINRSATRAGARALQKVAANNLPPIHRKKLDIQSSRRESRRDKIVFKIGPKAEHWGLVFLEYGAAPHEITPKKAKALSLSEEASDTRQIREIGVYGGWITKTVKHPGITATRFLSRAAEEGDKKVFDAMGKQYWKRIKKATK